MHVDNFIDRYTPVHKFASDEEREGERYARWVLMLLRLPAALAFDFAKFIPPLFCTWKGARFRVVHASHNGYVGLNPKLNDQRPAHDAAVAEGADPLECSAWGAEP